MNVFFCVDPECFTHLLIFMECVKDFPMKTKTKYKSIQKDDSCETSTDHICWNAKIYSECRAPVIQANKILENYRESQRAYDSEELSGFVVWEEVDRDPMKSNKASHHSQGNHR